MKKSRILVALTIGLLITAFLAVELSAQQGARSGDSGGGIALVDIGLIFKQNQRFKQHMDDLQADMTRAQQEMQTARKSVQALSEKLNDYRAGTNEYKQLEEEVAKRTADWNVHFQIDKKDFAKREAMIYHMIYQEIQQEVNAYAQARGISVVLRFDSQPADPDRPETVLLEMRKQVVSYDRNLDITPIIIESLNRRALQQGDRRNGPVNLPQQPAR